MAIEARYRPSSVAEWLSLLPDVSFEPNQEFLSHPVSTTNGATIVLTPPQEASSRQRESQPTQYTPLHRRLGVSPVLLGMSAVIATGLVGLGTIWYQSHHLSTPPSAEPSSPEEPLNSDTEPNDSKKTTEPNPSNNPPASAPKPNRRSFPGFPKKSSDSVKPSPSTTPENPPSTSGESSSSDEKNSSTPAPKPSPNSSPASPNQSQPPEPPPPSPETPPSPESSESVSEPPSESVGEPIENIKQVPAPPEDPLPKKPETIGEDNNNEAL